MANSISPINMNQTTPTTYYTNGLGSSYSNALNYGQTQYTTGNQLFDQMRTPGYAQAYNPNTMSMLDYLNQINPEYSQGYENFKKEALSKGPSAWLNLSQSKNRLDELTKREGAQRESNATTAGALDKLAMQGGLSSGARERAIESGGKNYLGMSQDISRNADVADLGLQIQDQSNKLNMLSQLPGMEMSRMENWEKAKAADVDNQQKEIQRLNQYNMDLYNKRMEAAAAERQARATASSGKK